LTAIRQRAHRHALVAVVLVTAVCAAFAESLFLGRVFFERDVHCYWAPQMAALSRVLAEGSLPLWNPWVGFGEPLLANASFQLLYPPAWIALGLPVGTAYTLIVVLHVLGAGLGTYLLALRLGLTRLGSTLAGAAYVLSGPGLSLVIHLHHLCGAAWMPWVLLAASRVADRPGVRSAVTLGAVAGVQSLAGSGDMLVLSALAAAILVLVWPRSPGVAGRQLRSLMCAGLLAAALGAGQWLPLLEVALRSERSSLDVTTRTFWSLHPATAVGFAFPVPWREIPFQADVKALLFEGREPLFYSVYLGGAVLGLAGAGLAIGGRWRRLLLGALLLASLLGALGRFTPVYDWFVFLVPPLRVFRYPAKALVLTALATALLAGAGLDASRRLRRWALCVALVPIAAGAALFWAAGPEWGSAFVMRRLRPETMTELMHALARPVVESALLLAVTAGVVFWRSRLSRAALALLCLADLVLAHRTINPTAPGDFYEWRPPTLDALRPAPDGRLFVVDYSLAPPERVPLLLGRKDPYITPLSLQRPRRAWAEALAFRTYPLSPMAASWGVPGSFDVDALGLFPPERSVLAALPWILDGTPDLVRLLRLGAVDRVAALHVIPGLELRATIPSPFPEPVRVHGVPGRVPRAYLVDGMRVSRRPLKSMLEADFDPTREAVLESGESAPPGDGSCGDAALVRADGDSAIVEVEALRPAILVLVDGFDPAWTATLDERPAAVFRVNGAFRGVRVPAGRHHVEMRYRPASVFVGLALTGLGLCVTGFLLARPRKANRPPR